MDFFTLNYRPDWLPVWTGQHYQNATRLTIEKLFCKYNEFTTTLHEKSTFPSRLCKKCIFSKVRKKRKILRWTPMIFIDSLSTRHVTGTEWIFFRKSWRHNERLIKIQVRKTYVFYVNSCNAIDVCPISKRRKKCWNAF